MAGESRKDSNSRTFLVHLICNAKQAWGIAPWREIGNRLHEALGEVERQKRTFEEQENEQQYAKT